MTAMQSGVPADVLNFDLLPDSAYVPIDTVAALFSVSVATIRRRIADRQFPAPQNAIGLQRYRVGDIRKHLASIAPAFAMDVAGAGMDEGAFVPSDQLARGANAP